MNVLETDTTGTSTVNFVREGIKIGLINGLFALVLMFGSYFISFDTFVNTQFITGFIPYMIIVLVIYGFQLRKRNGNYLAFKEGLQYAFVSYVVATLLIAIGTYILFNLVDKNLTEKVFTASLEKTRSMMERMGAPEDQINKTLDDAMKGKKETNFKNIFLGMGSDLIWSFVKSLVIALFIRREKPAI
jgi:hypothetical protein